MQKLFVQHVVQTYDIQPVIHVSFVYFTASVVQQCVVQAGWVIFTEVITYKSAQQFDADFARHGVEAGTAYSWKEGIASAPVAESQICS